MGGLGASDGRIEVKPLPVRCGSKLTKQKLVCMNELISHFE